MFTKFLKYVRNHKIIWLIFTFLCCLSFWNHLANSFMLDTCNSPENPVEGMTCGNMSGYYGKGHLADTSADIFLMPTRILYIPLSRIKSIYQLSNFEIDFTALDNTLFVPNGSAGLDTAIMIALLILQGVYLLGLATCLHWIWMRGKTWDRSTRIGTRVAICLLMYHWILPFPLSIAIWYLPFYYFK